jgi:hypothetical protein
MGHTGLRQFFHVPRIPYPTAQRNSFRDPGHVHVASRWPSRPNPQSASDDYPDSTSPFPSLSVPWMAGNSLYNPSPPMSGFATDSSSPPPPPLNRKRARFASRPFRVFRVFSTLQSRISNQRGVPPTFRYFHLGLGHFDRNCNAYPLDKVFDPPITDGNCSIKPPASRIRESCSGTSCRSSTVLSVHPSSRATSGIVYSSRTFVASSHFFRERSTSRFPAPYRPRITTSSKFLIVYDVNP